MSTRREIVERFFPPLRTEPTFGIVVELEARDVDGDLHEIAKHELDELVSMPGDWTVVAYACAAWTLFEATLPPDRWIAVREISVRRNMSEAERWAL